VVTHDLMQHRRRGVARGYAPEGRAMGRTGASPCRHRDCRFPAMITDAGSTLVTVAANLNEPVNGSAARRTEVPTALMAVAATAAGSSGGGTDRCPR
jgi:hypothetical protein